MASSENRHIARDSLLLMADLRVAGVPAESRVKVRNLSSCGMMGEGPVHLACGANVFVNIRNIGWTSGTVAWVKGSSFGITFDAEIEARDARVPLMTDNCAIDSRYWFPDRSPLTFPRRLRTR